MKKFIGFNAVAILIYAIFVSISRTAGYYEPLFYRQDSLFYMITIPFWTIFMVFGITYLSLNIDWKSIKTEWYKILSLPTLVCIGLLCIFKSDVYLTFSTWSIIISVIIPLISIAITSSMIILEKKKA